MVTDFEHEVIDRLGRIETKLDADYRVLHGNGKPGVVDKVDALEERIHDLEVCRTAKQRHRGALVAAVAFIVNAAIAAYAALKK